MRPLRADVPARDYLPGAMAHVDSGARTAPVAVRHGDAALVEWSPRVAADAAVSGAAAFGGAVALRPDEMLALPMAGNNMPKRGPGDIQAIIESRADP